MNRRGLSDVRLASRCSMKPELRHCRPHREVRLSLAARAAVARARVVAARARVRAAAARAAEVRARATARATPKFVGNEA